MLRIRFDHRLERLADALLDSLDACGDGPFVERVVIVPSAGIGRWLQRRDALRHGISARLRPEFAGRWLWQAMRAVLERLPAHSPFDPERVRWNVLALFDALPDDEAFSLLRARVGEPGSAARFELAGSVARAFDRYLAYRRDWLARWQQGRWADGDAALGPHEPWQRWLWQRLLERLPDVRDEHPYDQFVRVLAGDEGAHLRGVPGLARVAIFGRVDLSPEQFALFGRLSRWIDVSVFAPDPCRELWTDLLDPLSLARVREQSPDSAWLYDGEPSLLGSWGRVHRDFVAQVLDLEERFDAQAEAPGRDEPSPFAARAQAQPTALDALHRAVFLRSDAPWRAVRNIDDSIRVVGAHGTIREAEILHETLLECFETMPGLEPGDVAVFCADLDAAARAIEGVFESAPASRRIPLAVSGRPRRADVLVQAVEALVSIAVHGIDAPGLGTLLRNPALADALSLDEADVARLLEWFERAGARRGLDAADGAPKHNLQLAADRLLVGAAIGAEQPCADLLAVPGAQGSRARPLEAWLTIADAAARLRRLARRARAPAQWCEALGEVVETVFASSRLHAGSVQRVRDALAHVVSTSAGVTGIALDAAAFARAFADAIEESTPAAVPTGAVTVLPIGSLRGVPFRVVCLFGLDERAFPRRGGADEIDLMRRKPRFGDRLVRNDDRGAFLDAVLAARERLVVLCHARDARDDSALNPSPLVVELLGYLSARLRPDAPNAASTVARVRRGERIDAPALVEHPLHPFSPRNFAGDAPDRADEWLATARASCRPLAGRPAEVGALFDPGAAGADDAPVAGGGERAARDRTSLPIERVRAALADPAATYLRESLGVALPDEASDPPDCEPMWPDERSENVLVQRCAERLLAGENSERVAHELALAPQTAVARTGEWQAGAIVARALALVERASVGSSGLAAPRPGEAVVARVGEVSLRMDAPARDALGRALFVSAFPLGVFALVDAWLRTALWRFAVDSSAVGRLVTPDASIELHCREPLRSLEHAIAWSARIEAVPLALFPRSWLRYARTLAAPPRGTSEASRERFAIERAQTVLAGDDSGHVSAEIERAAMRALYRDAAIDFEHVLPGCERVYRPVFDDTSLAGAAPEVDER